MRLRNSSMVIVFEQNRISRWFGFGVMVMTYERQMGARTVDGDCIYSGTLEL